MSRLTEPPSDQPLHFGPFRLLRKPKQLLNGDLPVRLGGRALDLLIALTERAGEVVSRQDLEASVWPNLFVEESSLRVHIGALRKALGDGQGGARYIANVPGRGYCFVATVTPADMPAGATPPARRPRHNLPARNNTMIGRGESLATLAARIRQHRFVTVTGPGGIGKTTLALALAELRLAAHDDGARFIDLAPVTDPSLLPNVVATALEISVPPHDPLSALGAYLNDKNMLIVLDNCEHVIDASARLAEALLKGAPRVSVLATSREPLNAEGEWVYRLGALATPAPSEPVGAAQALAYAAVELFVERAVGACDGFALADADAATVGALCRQLDGNPLAIEFAAARVGLLGVRGVVAHLDNRLQMLASSRRTAVPRHQTLRALMDWSHELLAPADQVLLRRLGAFKGSFTLEAVEAVLAGDGPDGLDGLSRAQVHEGLLGLVAKSFVTANLQIDPPHYRMLELTRVYALEKLLAAPEAQDVLARHARHMLMLMHRAELDWETMPRGAWLAVNLRTINNLRSAIDWAFAPGGDSELGIELTAATLLPALQYPVVDDIRVRSLQAVAQASRGVPVRPAQMMRIQATLAHIAQHTEGPGPAVRPGYVEALALAEQEGSARGQVEVLFAMFNGSFHCGDFPAAAALAARIDNIARTAGDAAAALLADQLHAMVLHHLGEHAQAARLAERVLRDPAGRLPLRYSGPENSRVSMAIVIARTQWLRGLVDQAAQTAALALAAADHPVSLAQVLAWAVCPIALWRGDVDTAQASIEQLVAHAKRHSHGYWGTWGRHYGLALQQLQAGPGTPQPPVDLFEASSADPMQEDHRRTLPMGRATEATLQRAESGAAGWCAAEVLRVHGEELLAHGAADAERRAEAAFLRAFELAQRQGALSWQLRAAVSLAKLRHRQAPSPAAREPLASVVAAFTEGAETADLMAARAWLAQPGVG